MKRANPYTPFLLFFLLCLGSLTYFLLLPPHFCEIGTTTVTWLCAHSRQFSALAAGIFAVALLAASIKASRSAATNTSRRLMLISSGFFCLFAGSAVATIGFLLPGTFSDNLISIATRTSLVLGSGLILIATWLLSDTRLKHNAWCHFAFTAIMNVIAITSMILGEPSLPAFYDGPLVVAPARALGAIAAFFFAIGTAWYVRLHHKNKSRITYWVALGCLLMMFACISLLFNKTIFDPFTWTFRAFRLLASLAFLRAITVRH